MAEVSAAPEKSPVPPAPPAGSPMNPRPGRDSNVSAEHRPPSHSPNPEDLYKLETIYAPVTDPVHGANIDIVAVHGLSEDAESSWVFTLPPRVKGTTGSAGGKRESSFIPGVSTIAEGGVAAGNFAGSFVKNTVTTAGKALNPLQHASGTAQAAQVPTGGTPQPEGSKGKAQIPQSSNASVLSHESTPAGPTKVNWLKDEHMLPRYFPRARIMQFSYPTSLADTASNNLKAVASELLRRLRDERKGCGPGLSRPIIFIGHSFGGIVVSEALILAKDGDYSNIVTATVGLVFLGTPFQGSKAVVARLETRIPQRSKSRFTRPPPAAKKAGLPALAEAQAEASAGTATPPQKSVTTGQLYTLLDQSTENTAFLAKIRTNLTTVAEEHNISIACFYEKLRTEAVKQFSKEYLVDRDSAVLQDSPGELEEVGLVCTHTNLSKFYSSEDPSFLKVRQVIKNDFDFTATRRLWDAVSARDMEAVRKQLVKGANPNRGDSRNQTALHLATGASGLGIIRLLFDYGVNVNARDSDGQSPLRLALLKGEYEIFRALLHRGALPDDKDREIATEKSKQNGSDMRFQQLFESVAFFEGPRVHPKKQEVLPKFDEDRLPEECRIATGNFRATITTFHLRCEKDTDDQIRNEKPPDKLAEAVEDEDEREYHSVETMPLSELLYGQSSQDMKDHSSSEKEWKWYHLPANNMDWVEALFIRLGIDNQDGRLSGQEHRGRFPHTLFLQPQASVFKGDQNSQKDTVLFMPYLHFETNEGRIRLSNAIKRTASSLAKLPEKEDDRTSVSAESDDLVGSTKALFTYDDNSSESESEADYFKAKTEQKVERFKAKFKSFRRAIRRCRETLWDHAREEPSKDDKLVQAYLPLHGHRHHVRRTLDQFYYIGMEDTEGRDINQVVQRYAVKGLDKIDKDYENVLLQSKLIMVDQLWLWVLGQNTVITSFPQGWGQASGSNDDHSGVLEQIEFYLRKPLRDPIASVDALASVIIKECTRVFGRFQVPKPELQFLDFFDSSISDVADRHSKIFAELDVGWDDEKDFVKTVQRNQKSKTKKEKKKDKKKAKQKKGLKESQLDINEEVELLIEIQDIRDELNIIKMVLDDQHSVLADGDAEKQEDKTATKPMPHATFPHVDGKPVDNHVNVNRKTIEQMISRARDVYSAVYHLIDLKQKQANITEARYARKEAKSAAKEGKTILALTIVNMIFLPLSFMSSFFALNIAEFPKVLHLRWVAQYVFGISLGISLPAIALAMAIGPMAGFTKRLAHALGYWGMQALGLTIGILFIAILIALVPVAAGLVVAAAAVALAAFILYLLVLIVFSMCKWIWECTPYYRRREARKRKERSDVENAERTESGGPEINVDGASNEGDEGDDETVNEKGPAVVTDTTMPGGGNESQRDSGHDDEIEASPRPMLI
ncbi:hypothetical protein IFR05_010262 [Cadophora sp. M221]|nr:hypothetical protein IFR05_010262 [Cadophora sp. M221]